MKKLFEKTDLPISDLQKIGLFQDGNLLLQLEDLEALLTGRRTDLLKLNNLKTESFSIAEIETKLSLERTADGDVRLNLHPVYKEALPLDILLEEEFDRLISGTVSTIYKNVPNSNGFDRVAVEYDNQTKEFIQYDPSLILAPDKINDYVLSDTDKYLFQHGEVIKLQDGTSVQHRTSERKGILSDRTGLVISHFVDGHISYLVLTGVRNLLNNNRPQIQQHSTGFLNTIEEMRNKKGSFDSLQLDQIDIKTNRASGVRL